MREAMKTKEYTKFIFRDDNRERIDKSHVKKLVRSISTNNLLEMCPIVVNANYEIINGQHRLLAAKELGVDIWYTIEELDHKDIPLLNISKSWTSTDYLNYYAKNGYDNYKRFQDMIRKKDLGVNMAFSIIMRSKRDNFYEDFRAGKFIFDETEIFEKVEFIKMTQDVIKKINGTSMYIKSARFCRALALVFQDPNFDIKKWLLNVQRHIDKIGPRATLKQYLKLFQDIYNWKIGVNKIDVLGEE